MARERAAIFRLLIVIACYYFGTQIVAFVAFGFYLQVSAAGSAVMQSSGNSPWWFSLFHVCGAFENAGFGLLSDSYVQFAKQPFPLLLISAWSTFEHPGPIASRSRR